MKKAKIVICFLILLGISVIGLGIFEIITLISNSKNKLIQNIFDEYYQTLVTPMGMLPKNIRRPDWYSQEENLSRGIRAYYYFDQSINIVANEKDRTIKFIKFSGNNWYQYIYNAKSKTLTYSTNDHEASQRDDYLFTIVLVDWLRANKDSSYSLASPGVWNGEQIFEQHEEEQDENRLFLKNKMHNA